MNAKDKAEEIYNKFSDLAVFTKHTAINYSIIHVKGIIDCLDRLDFSLETDYEVKYWQQVLTELNKM